MPPQNRRRTTSSSEPDHPLLRLQQRAGNGAVATLIQRDDRVEMWADFRHTATSPGHPQYNDQRRRRRLVDPEQPRGLLPYRGTGWDSQEIARHLSQLSVAIPRMDNFSCVETSFIAELVSRGPEAVTGAIAGYISRYEARFTRGTPRPVLRRLTIAMTLLRDALGRATSRRLTYEDLSTLQRNMFNEFGRGTGTSDANETRLMAQEGYTRTSIDRSVDQVGAARQAAALQPGEFLSCGINTSQRGTGHVEHAIHIRRDADGSLYLFDPWPRHGSQHTYLDDNLSQMTEYFVSPDRHGAHRRTFIVVARFRPSTPPSTP